MANHLKMAVIQAIMALHRRGWSNRRIARELGVHRETVARNIRVGQARSKPAKAPPGSQDVQAGQPTVQQGRSTDTGSACQPLRQVILDKLELGLSAKRIHQDLVVEHGFEGSYYSVRRFVRRLGASVPLPFRRMECQPGAEAQVDFGKGAPIAVAEGKRRRTHVFRIVLSHSRKGYSEAVFRQTTDAFLGALENAFWHFGGVARTIVLDNLRAAVKKPDWFDPELNPRVRSFCEHYGTVALPAKPYTPRHKGKVERGIGYVQDNALKGRQFSELAEENGYLLEWETNIADTRIHGTTRQQVGKVFREVERPALLPLPPNRFPFFHEAPRVVHRDAHVEVEKAYYSVPPEYLGHPVWARWNGRVVRIFTKEMAQIAVHVQQDPGQFSTELIHIHSKKISRVERGAAWLLERTRLIGPKAERWGRAMLEARGIEGVRVLVGLNSLGGLHRPDEIDKACEIALTHGAFRLRVIRALIKRGGSKQEAFEFLAEHEIIRDLKEYGQLARESIRGSNAEADEPRVILEETQT